MQTQNENASSPVEAVVLRLTADQLKAAGFAREANTYNWRKSGLLFDEEHRTWWHWGWQVYPASTAQMESLAENPVSAIGWDHRLRLTNEIEPLKKAVLGSP